MFLPLLQKSNDSEVSSELSSELLSESTTIVSFRDLPKGKDDNIQFKPIVSVGDKFSPSPDTLKDSKVSKKKNPQKKEICGIICVIIVLVAAIFIAISSAATGIFYAHGMFSMLYSDVALLRFNITNLIQKTVSLVISSQIPKNPSYALDFRNLKDRASASILNLYLTTSELEKSLSAEVLRLRNEIKKISIQFTITNLTFQRLFRYIPKIEEINRIFVDLSIKVGHTFKSCVTIQQIFPSSVSGNYSIWTSGQNAFIAYCDMTRSCGGVIGGWRRVVKRDLRIDTVCPNGLLLRTRTRKPFRVCRTRPGDDPYCSSERLSVRGLSYSKVCGRVIAYQFGSLAAFNDTLGDQSYLDIDSYYVDGVSLSYSRSPRKHIWTFAGALNEDAILSFPKCPCINSQFNFTLQYSPPFLDNDYFCDTAALTGSDRIFYEDDPLWDGAGCGPDNTCCTFNNPPWFYRELARATSDDVEMRVCRKKPSENEDIAIEVVEIYVQ